MLLFRSVALYKFTRGGGGGEQSSRSQNESCDVWPIFFSISPQRCSISILTVVHKEPNSGYFPNYFLTPSLSPYFFYFLFPQKFKEGFGCPNLRKWNNFYERISLHPQFTPSRQLLDKSFFRGVGKSLSWNAENTVWNHVLLTEDYVPLDGYN